MMKLLLRISQVNIEAQETTYIIYYAHTITLQSHENMPPIRKPPWGSNRQHPVPVYPVCPSD